MEVSGRIIVLEDEKTYGNNGFRKRLVVVEEIKDQYPQKIPVEFVQDKCDLLNNHIEGQEVSIGINLRGSEYNGKYYLSAQGWKISLSDQQPQPQSAVDEYKAKDLPPADDTEEAEEDLDLPF